MNRADINLAREAAERLRLDEAFMRGYDDDNADEAAERAASIEAVCKSAERLLKVREVLGAADPVTGRSPSNPESSPA